MTALLTASLGALLLAFWPSSPLSNPYSMPTDVAQIADQLGFTDEGRSIFMDARPELLDGEEFRSACNLGPDEGEQDRGLDTIGCYYGIGSNTGRIAIFRPEDERLANQVLVTAAHEFLHAAYERLSPEQHGHLNALLEARWSLIPPDDPIQARFASSVGGLSENRSTEQFAYLGTEVAEALDPALEEYYAQYFRDRQAVVALHDADHFLGAGLRIATPE
ncbi:hypothetical protein [Diaminobutyricimonas sp. TR449]|nr:hypothetical protein [Diaminobutyricimonas sp. TR449]